MLCKATTLETSQHCRGETERSLMCALLAILTLQPIKPLTEIYRDTTETIMDTEAGDSCF